MKAEHAIDVFNIVSTIISILLFIGLIGSEPVLFKYISFTVKCMVGLILIYKFNDFRPHNTFTVLDRKICFLAGTYTLLFTLGDSIRIYGNQMTNLFK